MNISDENSRFKWSNETNIQNSEKIQAITAGTENFQKKVWNFFYIHQK